MARLLVFSLIVFGGCAAPRPDYRALISCELAIASLDQAEAEPEPEPQQERRQKKRRRWFRR